MTLAEIIATRGLSDGCHIPSDGSHVPVDGKCCAVEAQALSRGLPITDDAAAIRVLPVIPLNDSRAWRDDAHRTAHLGPVLLAIDDWSEWPVARQVRFAQLLAAGTNERVLPLAREEAAKTATATAATAAAWEASARRGVALSGGGQAMYQEMIETAPTAAARCAALASMAASSDASATWASWSAASDAACVASAVESAAAIETACNVWLRAAEESK